MITQVLKQCTFTSIGNVGCRLFRKITPSTRSRIAILADKVTCNHCNTSLESTSMRMLRTLNSCSGSFTLNSVFTEQLRTGVNKKNFGYPSKKLVSGNSLRGNIQDFESLTRQIDWQGFSNWHCSGTGYQLG